MDRSPTLAASAAASAAVFDYDVFVSHASEDKAEFVEDLVQALTSRGVRVWYDRFEIALGDDFRKKMEQGLVRSRYGLVVVSASFLDASKYWPEAELSALFNLEAVTGEKRVLPVLFGVSWETVTLKLPFVATRRAADASQGVDAVAEEVLGVVRAVRPSGVVRATRLFNVPEPSQTFAGRRPELDALAAELTRGDVRLSAAVEGLPGVGKTELALKLAAELADAGHFPGGIFWFATETPELMTAWSSDSVAGAMGVSGATAAERAQNAVNTLSRRAAPVLIILDNVETWTEAEKPHPLPNGVHIKLLVTTRRHRLGGSRFRAFPLSFLRDAEARELLTRVAGTRTARSPGFDELLLELGGHALAVELAGAYLAEYPETTPVEYLSALRRGADLDAKSAEHTRYERTVDQAFTLLWQRLDERVRRWWQLAACFAPEPVSLPLSEAAGLDADARRELRRHHLIEDDGDAAHAWRMHRLTRAFGRRSGDAASRSAALEAFLSGALRRAEGIDLAAGYRIYALDRAHFDAAVELVEERPYSEQSAELLGQVATALQSMGELRRSRVL
ncbi:MAG TPA: toll/interleukin-1 receptor domain-containing protein, partial [Polyangiaceae bacterium]